MWNGKKKAVTFSYDDGVEQDRRLIALFNNHGEESIISLICDITWAGKKTTDENGSVWQGTYKFNKHVSPSNQ